MNQMNIFLLIAKKRRFDELATMTFTHKNRF